MPATESDCQDNADGAPEHETSLLRSGDQDSAGISTDKSSVSRATSAEFLADRQAIVLAILAELLGAPDLERALDAFVGAVHHRLGARRVSLSLIVEDGTLELEAISQQARIDLASNEVRLLLDVMEECLDHEQVICFSGGESVSSQFPAHYALGTRRDRVNVTTVPVYQNLEPVGVLLIERHDADPFTPATIELLEQIALRCASGLSARRDAQRGVYARILAAWNKTLENYFRSARIGKTFALAIAIGLVFFGALVPLPKVIYAHAELVPRERRIVTVPFDGYVESVAVTSGERIEAGQLLARLETRELEIEATRRDSEIGTVDAEFRNAMASQDRKATAIARARLDRERALRELIDQRLGRVEIRAPIAGLMTSGDPADVIGAPVTRGDSLFEIAQADSYEVHLMVHERDIRDVHEGQTGTLSLRARPAEDLGISVNAIHPVAESIDGASRFRVRTTLQLPAGVTPLAGESGLARLDNGQTNMLQLVARPVVQQLGKLWWRFSR